MRISARTWTRIAGAAAALLSSTPGRADHLPGPASESAGPIAVGAIAPLQPIPHVLLAGMDAMVALGADGKTFDYEAEYRVVNSGPSVRARLGVPLRNVTFTVECGEGEGEEPEYDETCGAEAYRPELKDLPARLSIRLGSRDLLCRLAVRPGARRLEPLTTAPMPAASVEADGWCLVDVELPARRETQLRIAYRAEVRHSDRWNSPEGTVDRPPRSLTLEPLLGAWRAGPAGASLRVRVHGGRFADDVRVEKPRGMRWARGVGTWEARAGADLAAPGWSNDITLTVNPGPVLRQEDLLQCPAVAATVRVSSTLPRQGTARYDAENLLDGDVATAWCEGRAGAKPGDWIELSVDRSENDPHLWATFAGYVLVPGYAKSQRTWRDNGRVRAVRVSRCDAPADGRVVRLEGEALELSERADRGAVLMTLYDQDPLVPFLTGSEAIGCVRFTILEVAPGTHADVCVSELRPVMTCTPMPPEM